MEYTTCSCVTACLSFSPVFHRFPLYPRGERFHFEYGVYLLNKNIAQVIYEQTHSATMFVSVDGTNFWANKFEDHKILREENVLITLVLV